ncbi:MAG: hypothetical protein WCD89_05875 [Anaerocolumna sp.]
MEEIKIGQSFQVAGYGYENKVTVIKVSKDDLLLLWPKSGEPFVVVTDYEIKGNTINWVYSRYRVTIDAALESYNKLMED